MDIKDFPTLPGEHPADHWRRWMADGVERGGGPPALAMKGLFDAIRDTAQPQSDPNKRDEEDPNRWIARFEREEEERREPEGETQ